MWYVYVSTPFDSRIILYRLGLFRAQGLAGMAFRAAGAKPPCGAQGEGLKADFFGFHGF